jgi:hypothetical protein
MPIESIHLADLFKHDEIYWVPGDRPAVGAEADTHVLEAKSSEDVKIEKISEVNVEAAHGYSTKHETSQNASDLVTSELGSSSSVQVILDEAHKPVSLAPYSFEHAPTLDAEASPKPVIPSTTWLVIGDLSGAERGRLQLIFSAPPMLLSEQDWAIYAPNTNEPALSEFIAQAKNKKFIFLGQQPAVWQSDFQVTEIVQHADKLIYFFPRLLSTLTDAEKSLKLVFWNAIKDMK